MDADEKLNEMATVNDIAGEMGIYTFLLEEDDLTATTSRLTIYADDKAQNWLSKKGISAGTFKGFFSGSTEIIFAPYKDAAYTPETYIYYFSTRSLDKVSEIKSKSEAAGCNITSLAHINNKYSVEFVPPLICGVCACLLLMMTAFDKKLKEKEEFVKISLGRARYKIVLQNILGDFICFSCIAAALYIILKHFAFVGFMLKTNLALFMLFIILNTVIYIPFKKIDYKKAMYSAGVNENMLSNAYILKALSTILTIAVLSTNFIAIYQNANYINNYNTLYETFSDYSFINLHTSHQTDDIDYEDDYQELQAQIFKKYIQEGKAALDNVTLEGDSVCLLFNENSLNLIPKLQGTTDSQNTADLAIYIPAEYYTGTLDMTSIISRCFPTIKQEYAKQLSIDVNTYTANYNVPFIGDTETDALLKNSFSSARKPIITCINSALPADAYDEEEIASVFDYILFSLSDDDKDSIDKTLSEINKSYGSVSPGFYAVYETFEERCGQTLNTYMRITTLNTIISVFMILLDFIIVYNIISIQYRVNSMELALKKILGYTLLKRNRPLLLLNLISALIGIITMLILVLMFYIQLWYVVLITGALLLIAEYCVIIFCITRTERTNITKTLKGGSL